MEFLAKILAGTQSWYDERSALVVAVQVGLLAVAALVAWLIQRHLKKELSRRLGVEGMSVYRSTLLKLGQRLVFPVTALVAVVSGRLVLHQLGYTTPVLDLLSKLLIALAVIRTIVYALRVGIVQGPTLKAWEQVISSSIWILVALHLLGLLEPLMQLLDAVAFNFGETRISSLLVIKVIVLTALYILVALWIAGLLDRRFDQSPHLNPSLKVALSKISKVLLLTVAILAALTEAGLNLGTLTVFGGALGVGLGFGLQKIVSNFISGFILLGDRSIKPGDVISVGDQYGWVRELRARYIVVRNRDGVETLIPNENLVTTDVINWSYSDNKVRLRIPVQISYDDDPEQAMEIMVKSAFANARVLTDPEPVCRLMEFADSGISLELRVWLSDPEEGVGNIRSDINLAIWRGFNEAGITIPYPQRDVHLRHVMPLPEGG